jgi:2',3'-cyclic-nucleotide 2'-phosphodiesterase (5'-nucleotidase family)
MRFGLANKNYHRAPMRGLLNIGFVGGSIFIGRADLLLVGWLKLQLGKLEKGFMPHDAPAHPLRHRTAAVTILFVATLISAPPVIAAKARQPVTVQILSISDWRGQVDPLVMDGTQVGGAAVLSAYFKQERAANPNTLTLSSGGAVGASLPISSLFEDQPTVRAMRLMRFDADTLGNHNFDAGLVQLQSLINLASDDTGGVPGKRFAYVSANLRNLEGNLTGVKRTQMFNLAGVKTAVIGITNPNAPMLVTAGNFGSIKVIDPIAAANRAAAVARRAGADIVIAIVHSGVTGLDPNGSATGPLIDFANGVKGFDLILGGDETDRQFSGIVNGALVAQNRSQGATYSRATLTIDPACGHIEKSVVFVTPLASAILPDAAITALLDSYRNQLIPVLSTVIGSATRPIPYADSCGRPDGRTCESLAGDTLTDAMRTRYAVDFAIQNSGGLRADITCPDEGGGSGFCPAAPPSNRITRGQVLAVLPFNNAAVTVTVSGAELKALLENGVSSMPLGDGRFPQVSGLCFSYDISAPVGGRVISAVRQAPDGSCTGTPVDFAASATYPAAINDFMASGGDGYLVLSDRAAHRETLDQVLADYVISASPISPAIQGRIVCTDSNPGDSLECPAVIQ